MDHGSIDAKNQELIGKRGQGISAWGGCRAARCSGKQAGTGEERGDEKGKHGSRQATQLRALQFNCSIKKRDFLVKDKVN